ncbi:hypothetical protein SAMN05661093_03843 [Kibdelosporangium aridum]|uniref:Uncharacterized protein n=2 Tax=Kibdelosporangium aridum TaxID=2030 RepID=A0A1W2DTJ5_KIBAR|nr:hypothetical protein SAMN05661093_03843 [Kibdelosporangium aridum]
MCQWKTSKPGESYSTGFGKAPLSELEGQSVQLDKHQAKQLPPVPVFGTCPIAIGLPDSTTVIVLGTAGDGNDNSVCPKVLEIAKTIDQKLP